MPRPHIGTENFLANLHLFKDLSPAQVARLAAGTEEVEAPRGTVVYRRGDPCNGIHAVIYGLVKLSLQTHRGDEKVIELIEPGMSFGEAPMFSERPHILAAETLADSKLLHVTKDAVFAELLRDAHFSVRMIGALSDRLYQRLSEIESCFLNSGIERVIGYLLHAENGHANGGAQHVTLPATKGVIASRLNLTHEHFSRILRELITAGLIEVDGRHVRILDPKRLFRYAGGAVACEPRRNEAPGSFILGSDEDALQPQ